MKIQSVTHRDKYASIIKTNWKVSCVEIMSVSCEDQMLFGQNGESLVLNLVVYMLTARL
jgi:hypothetical protein